MKLRPPEQRANQRRRRAAVLRIALQTVEEIRRERAWRGA